MEKVFDMQKLIVKLGVSGTVTAVTNIKLYTGCFGLVTMQVLVPKTQQATGTPLVLTYKTVIDARGNRRVFEEQKFNMIYIGDTTLPEGTYMVFQRPMPKSFTETTGNLDITFDYMEISGENAVSRLASNIYSTVVQCGDIEEGKLTVDLTSQETAQINANTIAIAQLQDNVMYRDSVSTEAETLPPGESSKVDVLFGEDGSTVWKFGIERGKDGVSIADIENGKTGVDGDYTVTSLKINMTDGTSEQMSVKAKNGATGQTGPSGKDGQGVYSTNVEGGDLILYTQDVDGSIFEISSDGYLKINF